jgi:hypothetical protein
VLQSGVKAETVTEWAPDWHQTMVRERWWRATEAFQKPALLRASNRRTTVATTGEVIGEHGQADRGNRDPHACLQSWFGARSGRCYTSSLVDLCPVPNPTCLAQVSQHLPTFSWLRQQRHPLTRLQGMEALGLRSTTVVPLGCSSE